MSRGQLAKWVLAVEELSGMVETAYFEGLASAGKQDRAAMEQLWRDSDVRLALGELSGTLTGGERIEAGDLNMGGFVGSNEIIVNQATMCEIVQHWLNSQMIMNKSEVSNVKTVDGGSVSPRFIISIKEREK